MTAARSVVVLLSSVSKEDCRLQISRARSIVQLPIYRRLNEFNSEDGREDADASPSIDNEREVVTFIENLNLLCYDDQTASFLSKFPELICRYCLARLHVKKGDQNRNLIP